MSGENEVELIKMYKAAQEKYIYFLMAAPDLVLALQLCKLK